MGLGEDGTQQFVVKTKVDGKLVNLQDIHDPFIHSTVKLKGWRHAWNALFHGITVNVNVDGSHGAVSAVMMLDPQKLQQDTEEHLRYMAQRRQENTAQGVVGYYAADPTDTIMSAIVAEEIVQAIDQPAVDSLNIDPPSFDPPADTGFTSDTNSGGDFGGGGAGGDY